MPTQRIDFNALRHTLNFHNVLIHYKAQGQLKGIQWTGRCPLPDHDDNKPSFSANLEKGVFQCFGCSAKGNTLDFVVRMEGFDPHNPQDFRKGALKAQQIFGSASSPTQPQHNPPRKTQSEAPLAAPAAAAGEAADADLPIIVNAPLEFELTGLDPAHPYLKGRGLTDATIAHFGLGYASRGMMKGRIAIPLKNAEGALVGYAGRLVDESTLNDDNPKYRVPTDRVKDGTRYVFRKSAVLYHSDELRRYRSKYLVLVEGFPSVWWFKQHDVPAVVAVMGSSVSEEQAALICSLTTEHARIIVLPDGDAAGEKLVESAFKLIGTQRFMRWVKLPDGNQPTDWSGEEIKAVAQTVLG